MHNIYLAIYDAITLPSRSDPDIPRCPLILVPSCIVRPTRPLPTTLHAGLLVIRAIAVGCPPHDALLVVQVLKDRVLGGRRRRLERAVLPTNDRPVADGDFVRVVVGVGVAVGVGGSGGG